MDSIELWGSPIDAMPYAIANPQFKKYPLFGEFRGYDNPELITSLSPKPRGLLSTDPAYAPFVFVNAKNIASQGLRGKHLPYMVVSKE